MAIKNHFNKHRSPSASSILPLSAVDVDAGSDHSSSSSNEFMMATTNRRDDRKGAKSMIRITSTSRQSMISTKSRLQRMVEQITNRLSSSSSSTPQSSKYDHRSKHWSVTKNIPFDIVFSILIWYCVGVGSICTSKLLLSKFDVPPLVLTFQQLLLGSTFLRIHLWITGGLQSLPKTPSSPAPATTTKTMELEIMDDNKKQNSQQQRQHQQQPVLPMQYYNLMLMGFFNGLDFVATNTSFFLSAASFVETIKASEPISTSAIAVFYGIEVLRGPEVLSIGILVAGVFFSTLGNAYTPHPSGDVADGSTPTAFETPEDAEQRLHNSIKTAVIILAANICFALRIKSQKILKIQLQFSEEWKKVSDASLLMWMQQIGAVCLLGPLVVIEMEGIVHRLTVTSWEIQKSYWLLAVINAWAFATYCLAQTHALSKLSVARFTLFGCLRRMFAIMFTSIAFGVPITIVSAFGIFLSLTGFSSFSYYRHHHPPPPPTSLSAFSTTKSSTSRQQQPVSTTTSTKLNI